MTWTRFMDMHSGGGCKLGYEYIYIEAAEAEAVAAFEQLFDRDPSNVTCGCCGEDYSISESPTLEEATGYDRGLRYDTASNAYVEEPGGRWSKPYVALADYERAPGVLFVRRIGNALPTELKALTSEGGAK